VVSTGRTGLLEPKDHKGVSLVSLARSVVDRLDCVRPDMPKTDDRILDSICQFDFLAALAAIADHGSVDTKTFLYELRLLLHTTRRTDRRAAAEGFTTEGGNFPSSDAALAAALAALSRLADSEGIRFSGWDGFSGKILEFIRRHGGDSPG
jgi:hypothetical protein